LLLLEESEIIISQLRRFEIAEKSVEVSSNEATVPSTGSTTN
jgi:hypothetical protein